MNKNSTVERSRELRALAVEFAQDHPFLSEIEGAAGRCFWAALAFARFAENNGYSVELIRWSLTNELLFDDHWAVVMHGGRIIDHTRAQVDGLPGLFWHVSHYPSNYLAPRRYPASLFLDEFDRLFGLMQKKADGQFPEGFTETVKVRRIEYDADRCPPPTVGWHGWGLLALAAIFFVWRFVAAF